VHLLQGDVVEILVPSPSGKDQRIARCPKCQVAVWSNYLIFFKGILGDAIRFIRVGTLDNPSRMPPDVHIYTSSKQPWLTLPSDAQVVEEYYVTKDVWSKESLERLSALVAAAQEPR
jgi:hypothetical protein